MKLFQRLLVAPAALGLMAPVAANADTAFTSTTTLGGEAVFTTGSVTAGTGDANEEMYMQYAYKLELNSSFTGEDNLYVEIEAGNATGPLGDPAFVGLTQMDSAVNTAGNGLNVASLFYSFPIGDLTVTGGPLLDQDDVLAATTSKYSGKILAAFSGLPFSEVGAPITGPGVAVSYATDNGIVASASLVSLGGANSAQGINTDTGNDVTTFTVGYDGDGFGGGIVIASNDGDIDATGYDSVGGGIYYSPESFPATFSVTYDTVDPEGVAKDETSFGIGVDWEVGPGTLHAAYETAEVDDNADATDAKGYELGYSYAVNDHVTVTPAIFSVEEPNGTNDDSGVVLETTFSF